jgi:hypothetical protein
MLHVLIALGALAPVQDKPASSTSMPCVAVVLPSVEGVDDSTSVATSVSALLQSYLTGPSLRSIGLDAKLASQANQEAVQRHCVNVLTVSLTRKAGSSGNRKLGALSQAAGTAAAYIPAAGAAEVAVAGAAAGAEAVGVLAQGTRAKDEMHIEYHVSSTDGAVILAPKSDTLKAKSNGEDIVTPLVAKAADAVATAVSKK